MGKRITTSRRWSRYGVVGIAMGAVAVLAAPTASASTLDNIPGAEYCDVTLTGSCVNVNVLSGMFSNNGFQLPLSEGDMILSLGLSDEGFYVSDAKNGFGVHAKPVTVPGGVLGVDLPFNNLFGLAAVTAEVEGVGVPVMHDQIFDFNIDLPVRMKINNPFLGDKCYIGSAVDPVTFELRGVNPGTDNPPMYEVLGEPDYPAETLKISNVQAAATDFALPQAAGCGPFGVLNPIVNWRAKLPNTENTSLVTEAEAYLFNPGDLVATPSPETPGAGSSGSSNN
ncbi:hypothetical protein [Rhodococcus globerulus]|uniref:hypothetical protein n=1 Tax=Rhodococcus globerulus TaxID=33008 RepID=UPI001F42D7F0|nr:hypothetical protein [Rhodococcus globerulus]MCE4269243.1 hypothetical protein [Rhodococcus globerulus]